MKKVLMFIFLLITVVLFIGSTDVEALELLNDRLVVIYDSDTIFDENMLLEYSHVVDMVNYDEVNDRILSNYKAYAVDKNIA